MPLFDAHLERDDAGFYVVPPERTGGVPVRLFLSPELLAGVDAEVGAQINNATRFPGTVLVVITPDVHTGYGVPVGCVILTDAPSGAIAMGPVGFDIGCGIIAARSQIPAEAATPERRRAFNCAVMARVAMGAGSAGTLRPSDAEFERLIRGGAEYYAEAYGTAVERTHCERDRLPVDDDWTVPWGGRGRPERGRAQLGSLGGGNHYIELQSGLHSQTLYVQIHTGSRGFGHGLATNYFGLAQAEGNGPRDLDLGYFTPASAHYRGYQNAVSAGGNYAIVNRLVILEQVADAFRSVFAGELQIVYEISHNLVQREDVPPFGDVWVHRKGATRAFPGGHPALVGTPWEARGHPILIPGSNLDRSFILHALPRAELSAFSVNHGAGRRLSRSYAATHLDRNEIQQQYRAAGVLVNDDDQAPIDESAPCYKSARDVVDCVVNFGLAAIDEELLPLASLKGVEEPRGRKRRRGR
ncbi:MAG: RtcB family protein [Candidatus Eremiobacteraeota bacterium]|nr:RtcB family protein [Candidatus Eremiobacteraeota bacterium]